MTFEEFKADWRKKEKLPRDSSLKVTCACGKCPLDIPLTDDELKEVYTMILDVNPKILSVI